MYFATPDVAREGSTKLHKDVTSAVNLMVYCHDKHNKAPSDVCGAEWLIFHHEDASKLSEYLRSRQEGAGENTDLCHGNRIFIDDDMLLELGKLGIKPFHITQAVGQAVFIPAGCPHQVRITYVVFSALQTHIRCRYPTGILVSRLLQISFLFMVSR